MGFTKFEKDMAVIAALDNEPNDVGGLTADELKNKFDEAGKALQEYLNSVLLRELEGSLAAEKLGAVLDGVEMTVQSAIDTLKGDMTGLVMGALPDRSVTGEKLADAAVGEEKIAAAAVLAEHLSPSARTLFAPAYTAGTEDLTAGVSPLATGTIHLVYE